MCWHLTISLFVSKARAAQTPHKHTKDFFYFFPVRRHSPFRCGGGCGFVRLLFAPIHSRTHFYRGGLFTLARRRVSIIRYRRVRDWKTESDDFDNVLYSSKTHSNTMFFQFFFHSDRPPCRIISHTYYESACATIYHNPIYNNRFRCCYTS